MLIIENVNYNGLKISLQWKSIMEAFSRNAPEWTYQAVHAMNFRCPKCDASARETQRVWLNRYAPVTGENRLRKWQEFYMCECNQVWWGWSSDRINSNT